MFRRKGRKTPFCQNKSNFDAHFYGTGPEIWRQTNGRIHAFISGAGMSRIFLASVALTGWFSSAGTGGTIAGVGQHIKSRKKDVVIALADPEGSGLYNKVMKTSGLFVAM
jgi:cysteine synthase A